MKKIRDAILVLIGVACIVFGVMFIMKAGESRQAVVDELATSAVTLDTLNDKYDAAKAGLAQALAAGAAGTESAQSIGWQKASLGLAKSNVGTIDFIQNSGILTIVIGVGFVLAGAGLVMKD